MNYEDPAVVTPAAEHFVQLELAEPKPQVPTSAQRDVPRLEALLADCADRGMPWMSARMVSNEMLRRHGVEWSERHVRAVASESRAIASGPGSPGYALAGRVDAEQLMHIANAMLHQANEMRERGIRLRNAATLRMKAAGITATQETR